MNNRGLYNKGSVFFEFNRMLLIIAILLLFPTLATAEVQDTIPTPDPKTAPCIGLKPFKNIDELLYQIYSNLESDCLFKMDPRKLAEIWQIPSITFMDRHKSPVYSDERKSNTDYFNSDLVLEVAEVDGDSDIDYIIIRLDYDNGAGEKGLFSTNKYPKLVPAPLLCGNIYQHWCWFGSDKTRVLLLSGGDGMIQRIRVVEYMPYSFFENCRSDLL